MLTDKSILITGGTGSFGQAFVSTILNWLFLPAYPAWYLLMIGLDVLIIWAVVMRGDEGGWEEFD